MSRCESPEHLRVLTETIGQLAGQPIAVQLESAPPQPKPAVVAEPRANSRNRMQRMKEIEPNSLVKSCVDVFDAEIVRIDMPR